MSVKSRPYSDRLMDHFLNPRNSGTLTNASGVAELKNNTCGDTVRMFVRVEDGTLKEARFQACGCGPGIACSSYLLERAIGKSVTEILAITPAHVARTLELPAQKMHAAELAVCALHQAIGSAR